MLLLLWFSPSETREITPHSAPNSVGTSKRIFAATTGLQSNCVEAHAIEAILAIEKLRHQVGPHLLISEIRTIAADDLWMSTAYKRESVAIHFTWKQDWPAVSKLLPEIERNLAPFEPRPHWGKLFTMSPKELRSRYERLPEFVALAKELDPNGKLRNKFLLLNIFD